MSYTTLGHVSYATAGFGADLVADYVSDFEGVAPFFRRDARRNEAWDALFTALTARTYPRTALAETLLASAEQFGAEEPALENARAFGRSDVFAVMTGQQAGLFGGPLYTLYKALTAVKLARVLNERYQPTATFVPVFWVASDDHDLGEIDHAEFLTSEAELKRLRLALGHEALGVAAADIRASAGIEALRGELRVLLPDAAEALLDPYRHMNLGAAFAALMTRWLSGLGLVVVESTAIRGLGQGLFANELSGHADAERLIRVAGERMRAAGYEPGFAETPPGPQLFLTRQGVRARLRARADGQGFSDHSPAFGPRAIESQSYTRAELLAAVEQTPEQFSPTAALRPVLQDLIFPVAATVLGPGEMAYWAQLGALHDHYGATWPMLIPRASLTLIDGPGLKAMRKLGLSTDDLFLRDEALRDKVFKGQALGQRMAGSAERILAEIEALRAAVQEVDQGLYPLFDKAKERVGREMRRVAQKTQASLAQKEHAGLGRLRYLSALVRPQGRPQERALCAAQFVAGQCALPAALLERIEPFAFEHRIVCIES